MSVYVGVDVHRKRSQVAVTIKRDPGGSPRVCSQATFRPSLRTTCGDHCETGNSSKAPSLNAY